jgi:NAD(P)-dependent dehydrogenase (short-subunit alcohol dehydrogenase family)
MPELRFDDRVAVITGAGRGLGRAYALLLGARGAKVVVNDPGSSIKGENLEADPAAEVVREIKAAGGEAVACTDSVATPEGGKAIIDAALDKYGRIDILIHNAGIVRGAILKEMTQDEFDSVLDVHLHGAFHVVRPAFSRMCANSYGRVVLTSSINGIYGNSKQANYSTAKAGLIGLSNVIAIEGAADGVKSNIIIPAAVTRMADGLDTSQYPPMEPDLVAPAVAWLAHESCSITGEMLIALAGRIARAFAAETRGVYQSSWTPEQVAEQIDAIRNTDNPLIFSPAPTGHIDHLRYSFDVARKGGGQ